MAGIGTWSTIYQLTQRQARPPRVRPHKPPALLAERISSTTAPHVTTPPLCKCSVVGWKCSGAPRPLRVVLRQVAILPAAASVLPVRNGMPQFDIQAKSHVHFFCKTVLPALLHSLKTIISSLQIKNRKEEYHVGRDILVDRVKCRGNQTASSCALADYPDRLTSSVLLISQPTRPVLCSLKGRTRGFSL